jgi:hypothetical protein
MVSLSRFNVRPETLNSLIKVAQTVSKQSQCEDTVQLVVFEEAAGRGLRDPGMSPDSMKSVLTVRISLTSASLLELTDIVCSEYPSRGSSFQVCRKSNVESDGGLRRFTRQATPCVPYDIRTRGLPEPYEQCSLVVGQGGGARSRLYLSPFVELYRRRSSDTV